MRSDTGFYLGSVDDVGPIQAESEPRHITESLEGWLVLALWDFEKVPTAGRTDGLRLRRDETEYMCIVFPKNMAAILTEIEYV